MDKFNLLTAKWIPVLFNNGTTDRLGILDTLGRAGEIREIAASNPMDQFAAIRFLLTLLYWKAEIGGGVEKVREALLDGKLPRGIIDAISAESHCFDLFDKKKPFLQDASAQNGETKSAGSLFAEFACGTNIAHFHHGDDRAMQLCLPCAAIGLLRLVPWSQSGGAGLSPSVHNAPPIMAMACDGNLAVALGLNFVPLRGDPGSANWSGHFNPTNRTAAIPYLEALTWNPRRVNLQSIQAEGICWRCGKRGVDVVGPIVYAKNENTKLNKKAGNTIPFIWQDPAAFYSPDKLYITIKSYDEEAAAMGADLGALTGDAPSARSCDVRDASPQHRGWRLIIPCTNPANNKTFDHRQVELSEISSNAIRTILLPQPDFRTQQAIDGWGVPRQADSLGSRAFVQAAQRLFTAADWAILATAAYRPMHDSAAAFDLLAGLYWSLRRKKTRRLPGRNVAWLTLKLMAAVPSGHRSGCDDSSYCPLLALHKRQLDERRDGRPARSPYPVSLPRGNRLEAALRAALDSNLRQRKPAPIDWPGLCGRLNQLIN